MVSFLQLKEPSVHKDKDPKQMIGKTSNTYKLKLQRKAQEAQPENYLLN